MLVTPGPNSNSILGLQLLHISYITWFLRCCQNKPYITHLRRILIAVLPLLLIIVPKLPTYVEVAALIQHLTEKLSEITFRTSEQVELGI